jgi:teichuronic acid biosynthesis glycosyltransferase TuaH
MHVVFFTLFRTDNPYSSISLSMAKELAKTHRVIYVNHPYSLKDVLAGLRSGDPILRRRLPRLLTGRNGYERVAHIPERFVAVQPPVTLPINWLPPGRLYDWLQRLNNGIVLRSIRRALKRESVHNYLFINCYDPFYAGFLPKKMNAAACVYHCIDDITQNAYTHRHGTRLEREAMQQADLTLVTSTNLLRLHQPHARRIAPFFNAADLDIFSRVRTEQFDRPAELAGRTGPVIGFVGNLDDLRIDYPLLRQVAQANPNKTLLLVGPVNSPELAQLGINRLPNVVLAGSRPIHTLPPLLQHMDVVLIPFLCNTLTRSIYPLKINEYLAAGKPVVTTNFSDDIRAFESVLYLANDHAAFLRHIDSALAEDNPDRVAARTAVAAQNTWAARIEQLWRLVHL